VAMKESISCCKSKKLMESLRHAVVLSTSSQTAGSDNVDMKNALALKEHAIFFCLIYHNNLIFRRS
jgi:hypothetical protein